MNYYNEIDSFTAAWLRQLIKANQISDGVVDERSIEDVLPKDLDGFKQCHFFAGVGTWAYCLRRAGVSDDEELWTGSCPCQPFSIAGEEAGFADERHLWPAWFHLVEQRRPRLLFGEQVASKAARAWIDLVQTDLEGTGYTFGKKNLCAAGIGSPQPRQRLFFVGHTEREGLQGLSDYTGLLESTSPPLPICSDDVLRAWRLLETSPASIPNVDGLTLRVARKLLHAYGNGIVAPVAQAFIESYIEATKELNGNEVRQAEQSHTG